MLKLYTVLIFTYTLIVLVSAGYTFNDPNADLYNSQDKAVSGEQRRKVGWIDPYSFEVPYTDFHYSREKVSSHEKPNKKVWVDPYDMSYEPKSQSSFKEHYTEELKSKFSEQKENNQCEVHLQRLVKSFLRSTSLLRNDEGPDSTIRLQSSISARDLRVLKSFSENRRGKGGADIGAVSDIFHKIFAENIHYGKKEQNILDKLQIGLITAFYKMAQSPEWTVVTSVIAMLLATLWFVYKTHSYRLALFSLFLTLFFAGFGFTWIRLYEEAEVERFVNIQLHGEVPYHCSGKSMMWYEHMYYRMFGVNCVEFYKSRDVRPITKISPTDVLSETISSMIIKPATNIGTAYGNFCHKVLYHMPWWLKPIAVPIVFVLPPFFFILVLALFLDYRFSISITGFHLIPDWSRRRPLSENARDYVQDVPRDPSMFSSIFSDTKAPLYLVNWPGLQKLSSGNLLAEDKQVGGKKEESVQPNVSPQPKRKDKEMIARVLTTREPESIEYRMRNVSSDQGNTSEISEPSSSQSGSTENCSAEASKSLENSSVETNGGTSTDDTEDVAKEQ